MTTLDVSAAAREQMRTAIAAHQAREVCVAAAGGDDVAYWEARAVWVDAQRAAKLADRSTN